MPLANFQISNSELQTTVLLPAAKIGETAEPVLDGAVRRALDALAGARERLRDDIVSLARMHGADPAPWLGHNGRQRGGTRGRGDRRRRWR